MRERPRPPKTRIEHSTDAYLRPEPSPSAPWVVDAQVFIIARIAKSSREIYAEGEAAYTWSAVSDLNVGQRKGAQDS